MIASKKTVPKQKHIRAMGHYCHCNCGVFHLPLYFLCLDHIQMFLISYRVLYFYLYDCYFSVVILGYFSKYVIAYIDGNSLPCLYILVLFVSDFSKLICSILICFVGLDAAYNVLVFFLFFSFFAEMTAFVLIL